MSWQPTSEEIYGHLHATVITCRNPLFDREYTRFCKAMYHQVKTVMEERNDMPALFERDVLRRDLYSVFPPPEVLQKIMKRKGRAMATTQETQQEDQDEVVGLEVIDLEDGEREEDVAMGEPQEEESVSVVCPDATRDIIAKLEGYGSPRLEQLTIIQLLDAGYRGNEAAVIQSYVAIGHIALCVALESQESIDDSTKVKTAPIRFLQHTLVTQLIHQEEQELRSQKLEAMSSMVFSGSVLEVRPYEAPPVTEPDRPVPTRCRMTECTESISKSTCRAVYLGGHHYMYCCGTCATFLSAFHDVASIYRTSASLTEESLIRLQETIAANVENGIEEDPDLDTDALAREIGEALFRKVDPSMVLVSKHLRTCNPLSKLLSGYCGQYSHKTQPVAFSEFAPYWNLGIEDYIDDLHQAVTAKEVVLPTKRFRISLPGLKLRKVAPPQPTQTER